MKKLHRITSILFCFFFSYYTAMQAQVTWQPEKYDGISDNVKRHLFYDIFEDNKNLWDIGQSKDNWKEEIKEGYLYFESLDYIPNQDYLPIPIDENSNFEIEASIAFMDGDPLQGCGLQWGKAAEETKQYDFFFSGNGMYSIDKFTGDFTDYVPFTKSDILKSGEYNTFTVRKVDDKYYFFINGKLVHSMPFEPFMGKNIGFQVGKKSTIHVDYLRVSELINTNEIEKTELMVMDYEFSSSTGTFTKGVPVTLRVKLKNTGDIALSNPSVSLETPILIHYVSAQEQSIENIGQGEEKEIVFQFFASKEYKGDEIKMALAIKGVNYTNAHDIDITVALKEELPGGDEELLAEKYAEYRGSGDPLKGLNVSKARSEVQIGRYFALIIGIDNYSGEWKKLQNAVNDAIAVEKTLKEKYYFQQCHTLYNEEATRENIIKEMEWLIQNVTENDNVLIFFSGHGDYRQDMNEGFWIPVNASSKTISGYISNDEIQKLLSGIHSKHTLVIADACFSGDLFRGKTLTIPYEGSSKYYHKVYSLMSRKAISSGGLEPVMDGGKEGHSVFSYYLLKSLNSNQSKFYDGGQLYNDLKIPVVNNSEQVPEFNPIKNTGDEGGQFIFVRKPEN